MARHQPTAEPPSSAPRVSLVLGSGGARGYAHIGVIQVLEERGYRIGSIAGSSMGALVGGIYAAGELETYRRWVCALERMDVVRLLDFALPRNGLIKGERIMEVLRDDLIGDRLIEDLPVSYTAVATDIEKQKEVWIDRGPLFDAIRASIAIPTLFTPARHQGRLLLDGGLLNPLPVAPTLSDNTDITVAVSLSGKPEGRHPFGIHRAESPERLEDRLLIGQFLDALQQKLGKTDDKGIGLMEVVTKSWDTMQNSIARFQAAVYSPDVVIDIPSNACAFWEFHRAPELIELGRNRAGQVLDGLPR